MAEHPIVYVAGPIAIGDQFTNVADGIHMGELLWRMGYHPIIPHLTAFWHMQHPHTHESWMEYAFAIIRRVDGLLRMPGESKGADAEVGYAQNHGLCVPRGPLELIEKLPPPDPESARTILELSNYRF